MTIIDTRNPPADPFQHDGPQTSWERLRPKQPTCETCRWWDRYSIEIGLCRRPALTNATASSRWPVSGAGDWCGEHIPKQSTTD